MDEIKTPKKPLDEAQLEKINGGDVDGGFFSNPLDNSYCSNPKKPDFKDYVWYGKESGQAVPCSQWSAVSPDAPIAICQTCSYFKTKN